MLKDFNSAIKERRTYYSIGKQSGVSEAQISKALEEAVLRTPSAFNSQSGRVVLLLGGHHDKLWNIVKETLRAVIPADNFQPTEDKIDHSFSAGSGTVLFFDDTNITKGLQEKFPLYRDNFPIWAQQSNGMLQLITWIALENEGLGASLQHYNPLIDDAVKKQWQIPDSWQLIGQMPFGTPSGPPDAKEFQPVGDRLKIFK